MSIREDVIDQLKKYQERDGEHARRNGSPTWWFKFDIPYETREIRKELENLSKEGLVEKTDKSRVGQAHWRIK